MAHVFDRRIGRFRDTDTGRLVSEARIRLAVDAVADRASERMAALTDRLQSGEIKLAMWQLEAMRTLKHAHVAAGVVAHGGRGQMTPSDWGFIGSRLRAEYAYLRDLAHGLADGTVTLDGRAVSRARLYGQGARSTYEAMRARDAAGYGFAEERSMLHPADHCGECRAQAALGWVPLGTLIPIGERDCLGNCRCSISRRRTPAARRLRLVS